MARTRLRRSGRYRSDSRRPDTRFSSSPRTDRTVRCASSPHGAPRSANDMSTKTSDRTRAWLAPATTLAEAPVFPDTVAYWLEDELGNRVSKLFVTSEKPMKLAGRVLENLGGMDGWTVARRDISGARHVVASGKQLELAATPFMPVRTREEADAVRRFNEARRRDPRFPSRARIETDERVY